MNVASGAPQERPQLWVGRNPALPLPCAQGAGAGRTAGDPNRLGGRSGRAPSPGDGQPPFSLRFRARRERNVYLDPLIPPGEAVQGAGEDVADCQPGKEKPKRVEDRPHQT
jgi:hypothetical protein